MHMVSQSQQITSEPQKRCAQLRRGEEGVRMDRNKYPVSVVPYSIDRATNMKGKTVDETTAWDAKWLRPNLSVVEKPNVPPIDKPNAQVIAKPNVTFSSKPNVPMIQRPMSVDPVEEPEEEEENPSLTLRFLRWLFPEVNQRRAVRYPTPGLVAYYWTGGAPHSYHVGDMSATGLFLLTRERWAPGTLIQMTLQPQEEKQHQAEHSICLLSEVVRWSENGAGFNFILKDYDNILNYGLQPGEAVDRKSVERFLHRIAPPIGR